MTSGSLRRSEPELAAEQLGAMLEAEMLEPLLLQVREDSPMNGRPRGRQNARSMLSLELMRRGSRLTLQLSSEQTKLYPPVL